MVIPVRTSDCLESMMTCGVFNGVHLSTRIMPASNADFGGDWCESFPISEDVIALSIGDVCGHGIERFGAMSAVREAIHSAAANGADPVQTLTEGNRFLHRQYPGEFATALFALLDTRDRTLVFANAGHPAPLVSGSHGSAFIEYPRPDLFLGVDVELRLQEHALGLPEATLLVLYTDGVIEKDRRPLQGAAELQDAALFAYQFPTLAAATVIEKALSLSGSNDDDVAILTAWTPSSRWPGVERRTRHYR